MTATEPMEPGNQKIDQVNALPVESLEDQTRLPAKRAPSAKPIKRGKSGAVATTAAVAQQKRNAEGRNPATQKGRLRKG